MRGILGAVILWLALGLGVQAQDAQGAGIRDTISRQLDAFRADDFAGAFEFASPDLQRMFRSPDNFRQMVTQGYPMVWRHGGFRFLDLAEEGGALWQKVMITDTAGKVHVLAYRMIETAEGWRISGVQILDSAGFSA